MTLSLLTHVASLEAQRSVNFTQTLLQQNVMRLSSGRRISRAADDAAGLAVGSRLAAQLAGLQQAQRNTNDGISLIQTADAGLSDITDLLTRMRELAVQAASGGSLTSTDRGSINTEFASLQQEIGRIVGVTSYNGQNLIDGSLSAGTSFQVGTFNSAANRVAFSLSSADANSLGINSGQIDVATQASAQNAIDSLSTAINSVSSLRAGVGAADLRLGMVYSSLASSYTNLAAATSRINDTDVAQETAAWTRNSILLQAGLAVMAQANQQSGLLLALLSR